MIACSAITACFGLAGMYFTALGNKGVSQAQMSEALAHDRELIATQNSGRDEKIGSLLGHKDRIFTELEMMKQRHIGYDNSITEINGKIKYFSDWVEEQRKAKH